MTAAVVTYNGSRLIKELSRTLEGLPGIRCVVYDGGSTDGTPDLVEELIPGAELIRGVNLGFGGGCNRCLERVETDHTLLLNSDAGMDGESLARLVEFLGSNEDHAAVQPLVRLWGWKLVTASRGVYITEYGEAWDSGFMHLEPFVPPMRLQVPAVTAAASLWRTETLRSLGGFDEGFFMYFEDADLSLRAGAAGWKLACITDATAFHRIGASSTRKDAGLWELGSMVRMYRRYFGRGSLDRRFWKRELRTMLGMLRRGRWPSSRLSAIRRGAAGETGEVELPDDLRSILFGDPGDMPMRRPQPEAPGPGWKGTLAAPWAGSRVQGQTVLATLGSTGHAVTGAILDADGNPLTRFTVPAGGRREYRVAGKSGVVYIKCDSPDDEIKAGIR